jgi:hypothetical protein
MNKRFWTLLCVVAFTWSGCLSFIPAGAWVGTEVSYQGVCHGFTDGQRPCSRKEFFRSQAAATFMLAFVPLCLISTLGCGAIAAAAAKQGLDGRKVFQRNNRIGVKLLAVVLAFAAGAALGLGLVWEILRLIVQPLLAR